MKVGTTQKVKFKTLMRRLGFGLKETIGTLELLWASTIANAPDGAIGVLSDEEIAAECDWDGEPEVLIEALVGTGWVDRCPVHRLVIHDWEDHCPTFIRGNFKSAERSFAKAHSGENGDSKPPAKPSAKDVAKGDAKDGAKGGAKDVAKPPTTKSCHVMSGQSKSQFNPSLSKPVELPNGSCRVASQPDGAVEEPTVAKRKVRASDIDAVVDHYRQYHPRASPGEKERKLIAARFREGRDVSELCEAIDGCHKSPYHCGENPGNKIYQSLELICRDDAHVLRFIEINERGAQPVLSEKTMRGKRAAANVLRMLEDFTDDENAEGGADSGARIDVRA